VREARRRLDAGEFPRGSMGPTVEAAVRFVEGRHGHAVVTALDQVAGALEGRAGTHIVRDP
jgi:carbamate kinase